MAVKVTLTDNSAKVLAQISQNKQAALMALGTKAVNLILHEMQYGYGKPIRDTGDLMRDVSYEVENSGPDTVDVGNSLFYGPYVHEGTHKMAGRPYILSGLTRNNASEQLKQAVAAPLKNGFE